MRLYKKEQRQKESIDEVINFIKEKLSVQEKKTVGSLDNMNMLVESNISLLKTKLETLELDQNKKIADMYKSIRVNYWSADRTKEYIESLVDFEAKLAEDTLDTVYRSV